MYSEEWSTLGHNAGFKDIFVANVSSGKLVST